MQNVLLLIVIYLDSYVSTIWQKRKISIDGKLNQPLQAEKGKWRLLEKIDYIRLLGVSLLLEADSGKNREGNVAFLFVHVQCKDNQIDVFDPAIRWNHPLGGEADMLVRVDDNKAVTSWKISTMGMEKSTLHFLHKPIPFVKEILQSNKLVIQITSYNESPITAIFNTTGLENIIKSLRGKCK